MDILNNDTGKNSVKKPEMEMVQKQKEEYKLLSQYIRTKGLILFAYNSMKDELNIVKIEKKKDVQLKFKEGKLVKGELSSEECVVDSRNIHFEALNIKSAKKRLTKYKEGKIKELYNLRLPNKESIKLW